MLIETLAQAKVTSEEIKEKMNLAKETGAEIYERSEEYRGVAYHVSLIYFCIAQVSGQWLVVGGWWLVVGGWWCREYSKLLYCYNFLRLPTTSYCYLLLRSCLLPMRGRSIHTPEHKLSLSPNVSQRLKSV